MAAQKDIGWMYEGVKADVHREDYLLGKTIDKNFEKYSDAVIAQKEDPVDTLAKTRIVSGGGGGTGKTSSIPLDVMRSEDPLVAIRVKEESRRRDVLENPLTKLRFQKMLKEMMDKKSKKASKKEKKHKKEVSDDSDSDNDKKKKKKKKHKKHDREESSEREEKKKMRRDSSEDHERSKRKDDHVHTRKRSESPPRRRREKSRSIDKKRERSRSIDRRRDRSVERRRDRSRSIDKKRERSRSQDRRRDRSRSIDKRRRSRSIEKKRDRRRSRSVEKRRERSRSRDKRDESIEKYEKNIERRRRDSIDDEKKTENKNKSARGYDSHIPPHLRPGSSSDTEEDKESFDKEEMAAKAKWEGYGLVGGKKKEKKEEDERVNPYELKRISKPVIHEKNDRKKPLTDEEKARKLKEMQENAKWRDDVRDQNIKRTKIEDEIEEKESDGRPASFVKPILNTVADDLSMEQRLKSKKRQLQRGHGYMDKL